jgi:hypothetical protein
MPYSTPWRSPVPHDNDGLHEFFGYTPEDAEITAQLCQYLAVTYWITIREAAEMVDLTLQALCPVIYEHTLELEELIDEAKRDRDLLKLPLPAEEALAIWLRERDRLRLVASFIDNPTKRARIEKFLEEREAAMDALRAKAMAQRATQNG